MKIEKVNDNQIRCTLTREDLESRHMKLSELAYGTDKAKSLFREMMRFASYQYGFEADDLPLMIEAVPVSSESIVLIITKVDYPEELDTRFSSFVSDEDDDDYDDLLFDNDSSRNEPVEETYASPMTSANDILDLFANAIEKDLADTAKGADPVENEQTIAVDVSRLFTFYELDDLISLSHNLKDYYHGINSIFKDSDQGLYYLVISKSGHTPAEFNKVCNIVTEYGRQSNLAIGTDSYLREHCKAIIEDQALQKLSLL